jgi:hypothetical protein
MLPTYLPTPLSHQVTSHGDLHDKNRRCYVSAIGVPARDGELSGIMGAESTGAVENSRRLRFQDSYANFIAVYQFPQRG